MLGVACILAVARSPRDDPWLLSCSRWHSQLATPLEAPPGERFSLNDPKEDLTAAVALNGSSQFGARLLARIRRAVSYCQWPDSARPLCFETALSFFGVIVVIAALEAACPQEPTASRDSGRSYGCGAAYSTYVCYVTHWYSHSLLLKWLCQICFIECIPGPLRLPASR